MPIARFPAPWGFVTVLVDGRGRLRELWTCDALDRLSKRDGIDERAARHVGEQLERYFAREITQFDLPLAPEGTPFQQKVWALLREIPYGQTRTYGDLAHRLGNPAAVRAVGRANATNPIAIVIPCHRVIGSKGDLTGYAGGLDVKRALLDIETGSSGLFA